MRLQQQQANGVAKQNGISQKIVEENGVQSNCNGNGHHYTNGVEQLSSELTHRKKEK